MAKETELETLFYNIEARTQQLKPQIDQAQRLIEDVRKNAANGATVALGANIVDLQIALRLAKRAISDAGLDPDKDTILIAKLDADISALELQIKVADKVLDQLVDQPHSVELTANADRMVVALKGAEAKTLSLTETIRGYSGKVAAAEEASVTKIIAADEKKIRAMGLQEIAAEKIDAARTASAAKATEKQLADEARVALALEKKTRAMGLVEIEAHKMNAALDAAKVTPTGTSVEGLTGKAKDALQAVRGVDLSLSGLARTALTAFEKPAVLAGTFAAAIVTIGVSAIKSAAALDDAFAGVRSTITLTEGQSSRLRQAIVDLSTETPRSAQSLAELAAEVAKLGESDPAQIAADVRLIALAGDALGQADLKPLAELLDTIQDNFGLTANAAREALTQVVAISHGRIDIGEFGKALEMAAGKMAALGVSAQQTAGTVVTLLDAGTNRRQAVTGLIELLSKATEAEAKATEAAAQHKEGDARALRIFADTVNATSIESRGLTGALGDLYRRFDGNIALFKQAGLNLNDFQIAQKAAGASTADAKTEVVSYAEALKRMTGSAEVNRSSASALAGILKNELSAVLIDLGTQFLPPVITLLRTLADLFNRTKSAAADSDEYFKSAADSLARYAAQRANGIENIVARTRALADANKAAAEIVQRPQVLDGDGISVDDLRSKQGTLRAAQNVSRAIGSGDDKVVADALKLVEERLKSLTGAAFVATGRLAETNKEFDNTGAKAAAAAQKFDDLIRSTQQYAESLGDVANPLDAASAKIAKFTHDADTYIATLSGVQKASAVAQRDTILDQLATGFDKLADVNIKAINADIDALTAGLAKDATSAVVEQTRKQVQAIRDKAAATRELAAAAKEQGNLGAANTLEAEAAKLDALVTRYQKAGDAQAEFTDRQAQYEAALVTVAEAQQAADVAYQGTVPTLEALRAASATLADAETYYAARASDTTLTLEEHKKAVEALIRVRAALKGAPLENDKIVQTDVLTAGLIAASNAAAQLGQNLGESGSELGKLASGGIKLAGILKSVSTLQAANAAGSGASSAQKLSAKMDTIALVVGGVIELAGALDLFGTKAAERAAELKQAAVDFNRALSDFIVTDRTDLQEKLRANLKGASSLAVDAAKAGGGTTTGTPDFKSAEEVQAFADSIRKQGNAFATSTISTQRKLGAVFVSIATELDKVAIETLENEKKLKIAHDKQVVRNTEDLAVRGLVAKGDTEGAAALRLKYEQERELQEAEKDTTESGKAYVVVLKDVQASEAAAAAATKAHANATRILTDDLSIFGLKGADALSTITASLASQFDDIKTAVAGLDLSTQAGIDELKARGIALYQTFKADGVITDAEQEILDGFGRIYNAAVDVFDSLGEKVQRSLAKLNDDNTILGGTTSEQFGRTTDAAKGFNPVLDQILGSFDISTSGGAQAFRAQLQTLYTNLLKDGLTEEETVIVGLIKSLLSGLGEVIDEATADAQAQADAAFNKRQASRTRANRYNAVNDVEGADAFINVLSSLPAAISNMFGEFNLRTAEGIAGAKAKLGEYLQTIEGLTDEQVVALTGLPKNEVLDFILDLDSGLDGLASSMKDTTSAARDLANAQKDFIDSVTDDYLRSSGRDQEADINASKQKTQGKLETADKLGLSQAEKDRIIETGLNEIKNINQRYADQAATANDRATSATADTASATNARSEFVASGVTNITQIQALRLTDLASSQLIVQRDMLAVLNRIVGSPLPERVVPALPQGLGAFNSGGGNSGAAGVVIHITLSGPITGQTASDAARQLANEILPYIDQGLATRVVSAGRRSGNLR